MSCKRRLGRIAIAAFALATGCLSPVLPASAQGLGSFEGQWVGETGDAGEVTPSAFKLEIKRMREGGFAARWTNPQAADPAMEQIDARFGPADRAGVFALQSSEPSLIERVFARPVTGNPLTGETLLWARLAEGALILYSLSIGDQGHPVLIRSAFRPEGEGLVLERSARSGTEEPRTARVRLVRGGG